MQPDGMGASLTSDHFKRPLMFIYIICLLDRHNLSRRANVIDISEATPCVFLKKKTLLRIVGSKVKLITMS
jgi:hypothetical protein